MTVQKNPIVEAGERLGWLAYMTVMGGGLPTIDEVFAPARAVDAARLTPVDELEVEAGAPDEQDEPVAA
jgi:hypothetical protein